MVAEKLKEEAEVIRAEGWNWIEVATDFPFGHIPTTCELLVLEIRLPEGFGEFDDTALWQALLELAPRFLAYLISFAVVGVYWLNHHAKFSHIEKS